MKPHGRAHQRRAGVLTIATLAVLLGLGIAVPAAFSFDSSPPADTTANNASPTSAANNTSSTTTSSTSTTTTAKPSTTTSTTVPDASTPSPTRASTPKTPTPSPAAALPAAPAAPLDPVDLTVGISASANPVTAGAGLTYTLTVSNAGPDTATGVQVVTTLPAGVAVGALPGNCTAAALVVTCTIPDIAALGTAAAVQIPVDVAASTRGSLATTAVVSANEVDTDIANDTATATTTVAASADVAITKTASPDPAGAGAAIHYTLHASNNGPSTATAVVISDTLPAGVTFVSAPGCTEAAGTVTCDIASLAPNGSASFTINGTVDAATPVGTVISNTATIAAAEDDAVTGNNSATSTTTVAASTDVAVTKTSAPDPVVAGSTLAYTVTVANNSTVDADNVVVSDTLPANTTFVSAPGCTEAAGVVTCDIGTLAAGASTPLTITVDVSPSAADGSTISNTATVATSTPDSNTANDTATTTTSVEAIADVAITKSDSPDPVGAGLAIHYTLNATNNGPSTATGVVVSDTLPAAVTFVSAPGCTEAAGTVTCDIASLAPNASTQFTINGVVAAATPVGTVISNTASIAATETDSNGANNSATSTTTVVAATDVALTKTGVPDPVVAGGTLTYTVTAVNNSTVDADNVVVSDTLPANTTFVSAPGCTAAAAVVTCDVGTLAAGASAPFTIAVHVNSAAADGADISNTATVTTSTPDSNAANDTATATTTVTRNADIEVAKSASPDPVTAGSTLDYTLTVTNNGPSDASGVVVTDPLPAGTTFDSASPGCTAAGGVVTCTIGTLANGDSVQRTITVTVASSANDGATISNTATVAANETDTDTSNNSATSSTTVATNADLQLTKSAPSTVSPGGQFTYTLHVANHGPSDAASVVVTDDLPANTNFVSASAGCTQVAGSVTCTTPSLASGDSVDFTVVVTADAATPNGTVITNAGSVSSTTHDTDTTNNTSSVNTTVTTIADLAITKSAPAAVAGTDATFTLHVTNNGPDAAVAPVVTDNLDAALTFVSASSGCTESSGTVTCVLPTLAASDTADVTITATVAPDARGTIANSATVESTTTDTDITNNTASAQLSVSGHADVSIAKSVLPNPIVAGSNATYTIAIANAGPSDTTATVTDTLPAGVTFVSASGASCTASGQSVTCDAGTVGAHSIKTFTIRVAVAASVPAALSNTATVAVAAGDTDTNTTNNTITIQTPTVPAGTTPPPTTPTTPTTQPPTVEGSGIGTGSSGSGSSGSGFSGSGTGGTSASSSGGSGLPFTGGQFGLLLIVAAGALLTGAFLLGFTSLSRRLRRNHGR